ncbi:hypothetical protein BDZ90DRAFT_7760 [Jaminaea rosea]|uniref:C2H2-type domain-containing protein n=1 Tax=Jaminaea rosea TaxID=1569628 RepID=A0A316UY46_9BASI|nr:hypothetical protein BDZ90DRAFT_7760 [Jaminaea rosea]PWN30237.1 hypothetical protein BDZ90DRAFT_7760 [Jaminaea rosea]
MARATPCLAWPPPPSPPPSPHPSPSPSPHPSPTHLASAVSPLATTRFQPYRFLHPTTLSTTPLPSTPRPASPPPTLCVCEEICIYCKADLTDQQALLVHLKHHHKEASPQGRVRCNVSLRQHDVCVSAGEGGQARSSRRTDDGKATWCRRDPSPSRPCCSPQCWSPCSSLPPYSVRITIADMTDLGEMACPYCKSVMSSEQGLLVHLKNHHKNEYEAT